MSILPISGADNKGISAVKKQPTLLRKFCISIVGAMLALTFFLVGTSMLLRYRYAQRDMGRLSQDYLAGQKSLIKGEVDQAIEVMDQLWLESDRQARRTVQFRVDEAWSIANHLYRRYRSSKSEAEIKRLIIASLRPIRYRQGQGYYFITRGDGVDQFEPIFNRGFIASLSGLAISSGRGPSGREGLDASGSILC